MRPNNETLRARIAGLIVIVTGLCGCGTAEPVRASQPQAVKAPLWQADVTKCDGVLPPLPQPEIWKVRRALTPEQGRRQAEVDNFIARQHCERSFRIVRTTQDEYGNINDWLDPADYVASHPQAPLPTLTPVPAEPWHRSWPILLVQVPRQTFDRYVRGETQARSLEEYLTPPEPQGEVPSMVPRTWSEITGCDQMAITPSNAGGFAGSICDQRGGIDGHDSPPGFRLCLAAWIYTADSPQQLRECLRRIDGPAEIACDFRPVTECVARMVRAAPPSQAAATVCRLMKDRRCAAGAPFDVPACTEAMKPFSARGLQAFTTCIAMSREPNCQNAYSACFYQVTSY